MNLSQAIKPISYFKAHAADVIRDLNEQHGIMIITQNGEAKAVIQDITEYERIQEALALLKMVAHGQKDYEEGKTIPADQVFKKLDDMISKSFTASSTAAVPSGRGGNASAVTNLTMLDNYRI